MALLKDDSPQSKGKDELLDPTEGREAVAPGARSHQPKKKNMGHVFPQTGRSSLSLSLLCVAEQLKRTGGSYLSRSPTKPNESTEGNTKKVKMALRGTCSEIVVRRAAQPKSGPGD